MPSLTSPHGANNNADNSNNGSVNVSIVGLWQVAYYSGGIFFDASFDTWHADGTENDNDMAPPAASAVCEGVWEMAGPRTAKLHHVGWAWDITGSVLLGTFTLDEIDTLGNDGNTYTGTFTLQYYDPNGYPLGAPILGTISATRITVH